MRSFALLLLPLALAHVPAIPAHRRHHARSETLDSRLQDRAGAPYSNDTISAISAAQAAEASSSSAVAVAEVTTSQTTSSSDESTLTTSFIVASSSQGSVISSSPASSVVMSSALPTSSIVSIATSSQVAVSTIETSTSIQLPSATIVIASSVVTTSINLAPTTISVATSGSLSTTTLTHSTIALVTTVSRISSESPSATIAPASSSNTKTGIGKTTLVAIIIVASVIGLAGAGWTAFRKWKLKPSNRFDQRMKPIDFSPHSDIVNDDFLEKTLHRTESHTTADRQRQQFMSELEDPNHIAGIPEHDFTAGAVNAAGHGAYNNYDLDPYTRAEEYEYDPSYNQYPYTPSREHSTQEAPHNDGYADLQRGNSLGSGSGHGHSQPYPIQEAFPSPDNYLGRPTGGSDGPYAQAAQYRGY